MIKIMKNAAKALVALLLLGSTGTISAQENEHSAPIPIEKKYTAEIKKIAAAPVVKQAMKQIIDLEKETRSNHILLTEIPSPPYKEAKRAAKFSEMITAAGVDSVWTDTAGNVLALRKGRTGKKRVVLEAHMDTVFPEGTDVTIKYRGDTLYAPGVGDDTRSLSVMLTIAKVMKQNGIQTDADVLFVGATGEEGQGDLRGVKNLFSTAGPGKIDSFIAIDGSGTNGIVHRALGSHRYRITFKGPGGHSSGAFGIGNPHNALGRAIQYWAVEGDKFASSPGVRVTYSVGVIGGGTSVNSIPFASWMEVDMRSESPERLNAMDALLQTAVKKALAEENAMKKSGRDLTVDVKLIGDRPAGGNSATIPLVQHAMAAIAHFGGTPKLGVASTDSNIPFSKGVPAMTIGQGGKAGNAHSLNEWFLNDKGYIGIQQSLLILLSEAGLAK
jgi:tripeptide aminopeptidase